MIPDRVLRRVWENIAVGGAEDCWLWQRSTNRDGYGQTGWSEQSKSHKTLAHRVVWTAVNGPIPADREVDHRCRNRACCNPLHLRLRTRSRNAADNAWARQTHCKRGHEFTAENTSRERDGRRRCRACKRIRNRQVRHSVAANGEGVSSPSPPFLQAAD